MKLLVKKLWRAEEGQDLTEYALLLALAAIGSLSGLATAISNVFARDVKVERNITANAGGMILRASTL